MRKLANTSGALLLGTAALASAGQGPMDSANAYLRLGVDSHFQRVPYVQYGFAVDYDHRLTPHAIATPAATINFDGKGLTSATLNGMPFAHRVTLQEGEGGETHFTAVDWTLVAVGATGLGLAATELFHGKSSPDPKTATATPSPTPSPSPTSLPLPLPLPTSLPPNPLPLPTSLPPNPLPLPTSLPPNPLPLPTSLPPNPLGLFTSNGYSLEERAVTPEYQAWLDAGTGQMGDLLPIAE